jgi:hypothetical protein
MNVYLNFISGRLDEIQKITKEILEKIGNGNEIDLEFVIFLKIKMKII